ncbi:hypothetical protein Tco_1355507 [Tanacetum coccineum]
MLSPSPPHPRFHNSGIPRSIRVWGSGPHRVRVLLPSLPKAKGLVIHEEEQATTPTVSSQQPSHVKVHDKGKGIMVEEPVKMKKKDQISLDEELAFKLQAEEEEEERLA